ncbi:MAG TPA: hypothetical protein VIF15_06955 [Polyangiaceae bacterium]|jgi:hypothetical protein
MRKRLLALATVALLGCGKDEASSGGAASSSGSSTPTPSGAAAAPSASATPSAAASAAEPQHTCPDGSAGIGSFAKPCEATGATRTMTVKWTKTGDSGPSFAVTNTSPLVIVWGKIAVYFYDKAGKQLDVTDDTPDAPKTKRFHTCSGQFFGGVMNPKEKEVLTFSCVPKKVVPDGTASIQAEMQMVGFADASGKKIDFYWRNNDLVPAERPKSAK